MPDNPNERKQINSSAEKKVFSLSSLRSWNFGDRQNNSKNKVENKKKPLTIEEKTRKLYEIRKEVNTMKCPSSPEEVHIDKNIKDQVKRFPIDFRGMKPVQLENIPGIGDRIPNFEKLRSVLTERWLLKSDIVLLQEQIKKLEQRENQLQNFDINNDEIGKKQLIEILKLHGGASIKGEKITKDDVIKTIEDRKKRFTSVIGEKQKRIVVIDELLGSGMQESLDRGQTILDNANREFANLVRSDLAQELNTSPDREAPLRHEEIQKWREQGLNASPNLKASLREAARAGIDFSNIAPEQLQTDASINSRLNSQEDRDRITNLITSRDKVRKLMDSLQKSQKELLGLAIEIAEPLRPLMPEDKVRELEEMKNKNTLEISDIVDAIPRELNGTKDKISSILGKEGEIQGSIDQLRFYLVATQFDLSGDGRDKSQELPPQKEREGLRRIKFNHQNLEIALNTLKTKIKEGKEVSESDIKKLGNLANEKDGYIDEELAFVKKSFDAVSRYEYELSFAGASSEVLKGQMHRLFSDFENARSEIDTSREKVDLDINSHISEIENRLKAANTVYDIGNTLGEIKSQVNNSIKERGVDTKGLSSEVERLGELKLRKIDGEKENLTSAWKSNIDYNSSEVQAELRKLGWKGEKIDLRNPEHREQLANIDFNDPALKVEMIRFGWGGGINFNHPDVKAELGRLGWEEGKINLHKQEHRERLSQFINDRALNATLKRLGWDTEIDFRNEAHLKNLKEFDFNTPPIEDALTRLGWQAEPFDFGNAKHRNQLKSLDFDATQFETREQTTQETNEETGLRGVYNQAIETAMPTFDRTKANIQKLEAEIMDPQSDHNLQSIKRFVALNWRQAQVAADLAITGPESDFNRILEDFAKRNDFAYNKTQELLEARNLD